MAEFKASTATLDVEEALPPGKGVETPRGRGSTGIEPSNSMENQIKNLTELSEKNS